MRSPRGAWPMINGLFYDKYATVYWCCEWRVFIGFLSIAIAAGALPQNQPQPSIPSARNDQQDQNYAYPVIAPKNLMQQYYESQQAQSSGTGQQPAVPVGTAQQLMLGGFPYVNPNAPRNSANT